MISSNGIIHDICSQQSRAKKLLKFNPTYSDVLKYLVNQNYYEGEYIDYPTLGDIRTHLDLPYDKARQAIMKIHKDLSSNEPEKSFPFRG